jgi:hypothetical protein
MFTPRLCDYRRAAPDYSSKMEDVPVRAVRPDVEGAQSQDRNLSAN